MPRLFTGLKLPQSLAFDLSLMRGGLSGARWINAEDYHITLRFIGDVDGATADDVYDLLARVRRPPLDVTLDTLTSFGGDKPRALVARAKPTPQLLELQAEHERLLRRIGMAPETRRYTPHVTLARLRATGSSEMAHYLADRGLFATRRFPVDHFVLFSARDSVGGGPYVVEASYPLN